MTKEEITQLIIDNDLVEDVYDILHYIIMAKLGNLQSDLTKASTDLRLVRKFADAVLSGEKTFEVRENDRGYQKGDLIKFEVKDKYGFSVYGHDLEKQQYEITYVLSGWGIKDGWVVFGIKEVGGDT